MDQITRGLMRTAAVNLRVDHLDLNQTGVIRGLLQCHLRFPTIKLVRIMDWNHKVVIQASFLRQSQIKMVGTHLQPDLMAGTILLPINTTGTCLPLVDHREIPVDQVQ